MGCAKGEVSKKEKMPHRAQLAVRGFKKFMSKKGKENKRNGNETGVGSLEV